MPLTWTGTACFESFPKNLLKAQLVPEASQLPTPWSSDSLGDKLQHMDLMHVLNREVPRVWIHHSDYHLRWSLPDFQAFTEWQQWIMLKSCKVESTTVKVRALRGLRNDESLHRHNEPRGGSPESLAPPCSIRSATTKPFRRQHFIAVSVEMPKMIIIGAGGSSSHLHEGWGAARCCMLVFVTLPHRALCCIFFDHPPHLPANISLSAKLLWKHLLPRSTTPRRSLWPTHELLMSRQSWHHPPTHPRPYSELAIDPELELLGIITIYTVHASIQLLSSTLVSYEVTSQTDTRRHTDRTVQKLYMMWWFHWSSD